MLTTSGARPPIPPRMILFVGAVAFAIRVLHNQALLADPLYYNPLGGNVPYLEMASRIAQGDWLPDGAFTVNSPLYPYILALLYKVFGDSSYFAVRLVGATVDSGTCILAAILACRRFGPVAGWGTGLLLAVYGPMVFFATDLTPVPYTLFLLTGALLLLDSDESPKRFGAAGLLLGLATATRPNVLLAGLLALLVPWARRLPGSATLTTAVAAGLVLGIAPVTLANMAGGGGLVPLTRSGGHNLYIGHNPAAQAQYSLPGPLDGDIFLSMKGLAETVEGRPFDDSDVSPYYVRRSLDWTFANPGREAALLARRALLLINDFEATTYASYEYQKVYSPLLRWSPSFLVLILLAAPGMLLVLDRRSLHLWIPVLTAAATVLLFFYIARLRVLMVPALGIFAGAAIARAVSLGRAKTWDGLGAAASVAVLAGAVSLLPLLEPDTSNEWNKAGGVLRVLGRYEEAAAALDRAQHENPDNPNTYRNLAALYGATVGVVWAEAAEARAAELLAGQEREGEAFLRGLEGEGP